MSRLEDLKKNLLDMSPEEMRERIRFVREDRRLTKQTEKAPAVRRKKVAKSAMDLLAGLTPEMAAKLLKQLGGK